MAPAEMEVKKEKLNNSGLDNAVSELLSLSLALFTTFYLHGIKCCKEYFNSRNGLLQCGKLQNVFFAFGARNKSWPLLKH